jgi:phospholipid/cholesterol/gamma-HCH transport system substrate-binding protein
MTVTDKSSGGFGDMVATPGRRGRLIIGIAGAVVLVLVAVVIVRSTVAQPKNIVTGYFATSDGIYVGDNVQILGVPVGSVDKIEPGPDATKITFSVDKKYKVPADAKAAILSPSLVSARSMALVPGYTGGPTLDNDAVIPIERTAVPVEWDDFRVQIEKLTDSLKPQPGETDSSPGELIDTAAANLRGEGLTVNSTLSKMSEALSILGDKSTDIFSTVRNLQVFVSALSSSSDLLAQLNNQLADVSTLLSNEPNEVARATADLDGAIHDVGTFVAENRDRISTTTSQLASVTTALQESKGDLEQTLHIAPTSFQNFVNIFQPAQSALTGILAFNNFANPLQFICGMIQAAAQKGAEESAKLCAQYLGPVLKNLAINFPAIGVNPITGVQARPDEITYSEEDLKPATPAPKTAPKPVPARKDPLAGLLAPAGGER